ncbi:MAG: hypothetical protein U0840_01240 [Gemmataceae bacterium]
MTSSLKWINDTEVLSDVVALPKVDLHVHGEGGARLERLAARQEGEPERDWQAWAYHMAQAAPGEARLAFMSAMSEEQEQRLRAMDADPDSFLARCVDLLTEGAVDGAILIEVLLGSGVLRRPHFMELFREAERRVQQNFPALHAEALVCVTRPGGDEWREVLFPACLAAARQGLAGIHIIPYPYYEAEADWSVVRPWVERARSAGLGIAVHAGEFSSANLACALHLPGVSRLAHAIHAAHDPHLLDQIARAGITIECCLTSNVLFGAIPRYEDHPLRRFLAHGISVTLNTDNPVHLGTTIGREYAIAHQFGFSLAELRQFTRSAVLASFAPPKRRAALLARFESAHPPGCNTE